MKFPTEITPEILAKNSHFSNEEIEQHIKSAAAAAIELVKFVDFAQALLAARQQTAIQQTTAGQRRAEYAGVGDELG